MLPGPHRMDKPRRFPFRFRLTLGGLVVLVALIALGLNYLRPRSTRIDDIKVGTGTTVKTGDSVTVHYVGRLTDGTVFDESKPRGQPITIGVGKGMVIKGWDVGLVGMQAGGVRRLTIPPEEAYGERGAPPQIPPNSTLIFEIELLQIP